MSSSFRKPIRIPGRRTVITKGMIEEAQKILGIDDEQINKKKKPIINKDKEKFLNPPKSSGCTASFISQGMSSEEAQKHCDNLWKNELRRRDSGRTVPA